MIGSKYEIILREDYDISNIELAESKIFHSFSLPSWLGNDYDVRVLLQAEQNHIKYYEI